MCDELGKNVNAIQIIHTCYLVKKADNNMQFEDIEKKTHEHDKYITREFNKLTKDSVLED